MIAKSVVEAVIALNLEGLVAGCLGLSCFSFDELGGVCIDLNEVLVMGRKIRDEVSGGAGDEHEAMCIDCLDSEIFVSPEVLSKLLNKVLISPESGDSRYPIGYGSDVWSLACVLLRLLIGNAFPRITLEVSEENGLDVLASYISWVEKVNSVLEEKFGSEYLSLKQTLCKCLDINPGSRPDVVDVRKCIQDVLVKHQFGILGNTEITVNRNNIDHPVILAMLFQLVEESSKELREHEVKEDGGQPDFLQGAENKSDEDFVASLSNGMT
ncbi:protein translocase subunit SecA chloroplastic-like, partial [Trifolium medium]|nr:protein translocase subunit SecA chloroplastic-like [Trifolium medium]